MPKPGRVLFVCGLRREAGLVTSAQGLAICGNRETLQAEFRRLQNDPISLVVSFGICGGLGSSLRAGDIVLASQVIGSADRVVDATYRVNLDDALRRDDVHTTVGPVVAVDKPVLTASDKAALHATTGAIAVDMESGIASEFAAALGVPFVVLRSVSDVATRNLPSLVVEATDAKGDIRYGAVARHVLRDPLQIPALIAAGRDSAAAFKALGRAYLSFARLFLGLGRADLR